MVIQTLFQNLVILIAYLLDKKIDTVIPENFRRKKFSEAEWLPKIKYPNIVN